MRAWTSPARRPRAGTVRHGLGGFGGRLAFRAVRPQPAHTAPETPRAHMRPRGCLAVVVRVQVMRALARFRVRSQVPHASHSTDLARRAHIRRRQVRNRVTRGRRWRNRSSASFGADIPETAGERLAKVRRPFDGVKTAAEYLGHRNATLTPPCVKFAGQIHARLLARFHNRKNTARIRQYRLRTALWA